MASEHPAVSVSPNNPVFDLPIYVARDEGLFAKAGIEVRFQAKYTQRNPSDKEAFARLKESLFEQGKADVYNLCEWAGIDRSERSSRGAQVLALRPAVGAQAILSFDAAIQEPRDLAGVPVGINDRTGSHYTTLQSLEGVLARGDIVVEHLGIPENRYQALKDGRSRAVAVMEPFISLGLKEGAHVIAASFYRGGEVIAADLTPEQRKTYYDAENKAVDLINADFYKYAHHVAAHAKGALEPRELLRAFVRYKHVDYYDPTLFNRAYDWMKARGLSEGQSQHAALVVG
jgi:NitT/TauT family transport system substrate-binding protein